MYSWKSSRYFVSTMKQTVNKGWRWYKTMGGSNCPQGEYRAICMGRYSLDNAPADANIMGNTGINCTDICAPDYEFQTTGYMMQWQQMHQVCIGPVRAPELAVQEILPKRLYLYTVYPAAISLQMRI